MNTKHLLAVIIAVVAGNMLVACRQPIAANPSRNPYYQITHQAETFGFTAATFNRLQAVFNQRKSTDFKSAFYYYNYGCGYFHTCKKDELTALRYADSMLLTVHDKADPETDQAEIAIANLSEGDILFALKRYNEAYEYYYNGKVAADKSGDQYTMSEYSYRLGMATYRRENYGVAARYFIDAFEQSGHRNNSFSDFYRRQEVLNNAALSYLYNNKPDSAIWFCNKGLRYIADNEGRYTADKKELIQAAWGVMYGTMGRAYLQEHDTTGAGLLQKSIAINSVPGRENGDALKIQTCLAKYYLDTNFSLQLPKAYSVLTAIQHGLDTLYNNETATQWNELMSRYSALTGNKEAAYNYLLRYNTLNEQQITANKALAEINISSRFKLLQDRYDMSLLKANNQLKTVYLQIAVLLCLLAGVILLLIQRSWKKEKKNSQTLAALNKQVEQQKIQLEAMVKQLNQQVKTKDYILRVVAHDLRNPISAISTLSRIVTEEYENEEDNKEFLEMVQSACKDSLNMIDSIMQLSEHGKPEALHKRIFDINETVLDCVELLRFRAEEKQQEIILHTSKTPQYTLADADKINRIINNLLMNAIKFSFPHSAIDVYVKDQDDHVEIEVKDKGIGIPADMLDKVFDVFTEARRKGTSKEGTFGLGLSICKQLVEAHGGKIWLESEEGKGSAFHVLLNKISLPQYEQEYETENASSY